MSRISIAQRCGARILDANDADDSRILEELRADSGVEFIDRWQEQASALQLRPSPTRK